MLPNFIVCARSWIFFSNHYPSSVSHMICDRSKVASRLIPGLRSKPDVLAVAHLNTACLYYTRLPEWIVTIRGGSSNTPEANVSCKPFHMNSHCCGLSRATNIEKKAKARAATEIQSPSACRDPVVKWSGQELGLLLTESPVAQGQPPRAVSPPAWQRQVIGERGSAPRLHLACL